MTPVGLCRAAGLGISTQALSAFRQPDKGLCCKDAAAKTVEDDSVRDFIVTSGQACVPHGAFFHNSCIINEEENHVLCLYLFN